MNSPSTLEISVPINNISLYPLAYAIWDGLVGIVVVSNINKLYVNGYCKTGN